MSTVLRWAALTRDEVAAAAPSALVVVPTGTTAQHGPHLATGTDAQIAEAVAERAAAAATAPETVLIAPTLAYGASHHHLPFGGTLSLGVTTFQAVLRDLLASAAAAGCRRVFVLNGHGGNKAACAIAVAEASRELELVAATRPWSREASETAIAHALALPPCAFRTKTRLQPAAAADASRSESTR